MSRTKGARNFKRSVFAVYDLDEQCVCVGFIEELVKFMGLKANKKSEQKIYFALCQNNIIFGKYKICKIDEEITGSGRRKKKWK